MSDAWLDKLRDPDPWKPPRPLPGPVVTDALEVRLYRPGDGPALHAAIAEHRGALLPWMPWAAMDHQSLDDTIHFVERSRRGAERPECLDFLMGIWDRSDGTVVGGTGLHRIRAELREVEIGYWVRGDRHGEGLCTRAIGALLSSVLRPVDDGGWGFRRALVFNEVANVGSRRVCEKLGLRLEMRMRKERYLEPEYRDTLGFAVLTDEWDFEHHRALPGIGWPAPLGL